MHVVSWTCLVHLVLFFSAVMSKLRTASTETDPLGGQYLVHDVAYSYHASHFLEKMMCFQDAMVFKYVYSNHCPEDAVTSKMLPFNL